MAFRIVGIAWLVIYLVFTWFLVSRRPVQAVKLGSG